MWKPWRKDHEAEPQKPELRVGGVPDDVAYAGTPLDPAAGPPAIPQPAASPGSGVGNEATGDGGELRQSIIDTMRTVYDPEIPVNIYDIGLIYDLQIDPTGHVGIRMTLTSPMCPAAESLPPEVEQKVAAVPGVRDVTLDLVWDPPWTPAMMSEEARLLLNIGG